jgi:hypothetical protein
MKRCILCSVLVMLVAFTVYASDVEFRVVTLKNVTDARELSVLRDELFLGSEAIQRILITDLLSDGFDENDMVQLYPSGRVLKLAPITPRLDSLLRSYRLPSNVEIHDTKAYFGRYDSLARERYGGQALGYGILGGVAERLQTGYRGDNMEGYVKFTPSGVSVLAWNFDSSRVNFPPTLPPRSDTVFIYLHDTLRIPEVITVTSEPKIIRDTVFIPSDLLLKPRGFFYRIALGMFGGGYSDANRKASKGRMTLGAGNEWDFGVWDPWISGRQDLKARVGLRFLTDMAPWKTDTLAPRFLASSFEAMYIPAWDRSLFVFSGFRAYYNDDLYWDRVRAAWDESLIKEPTEQKLGHYELTVKFGADKFASYGTGKRFGAWLKLSGILSGGKSSQYDLTVTPDAIDINPVNALHPAYGQQWQLKHKDGADIEAALTARLAESAQAMVSIGEYYLDNPTFSWYSLGDSVRTLHTGGARLSQFYQTISARFAPVNTSDFRIMLEGAFRNNVLAKTIAKNVNDVDNLNVFKPYLEAPEVSGAVQMDWSILRLRLGARYFFPSGKDAQLRPEGSLHLMLK